MAPAQRRQPVEILHLSMPRTGSVSMMEAYKILGYATYHGFDFMDRTEDQVQWEKAINAKWYNDGKPFEREDFDSFLGDFEVLSDMPAIGFAEEFLQMYPEAKVVLVDRDIDKWYHSFDTQIISSFYTVIARVLVSFLEPYFMRARPATLTNKEAYAMFQCHDQESFRANARDTYQEHYRMIRRSVPKERLLNYELGSGWGPLCEFLGKDVPDCEFPFKNESKEFAIWMRKTQIRVLKDGLRQLRRIIPIISLIGVVMYWVSRRGLFSD